MPKTASGPGSYIVRLTADALASLESQGGVERVRQALEPELGFVHPGWIRFGTWPYRGQRLLYIEGLPEHLRRDVYYKGGAAYLRQILTEDLGLPNAEVSPLSDGNKALCIRLSPPVLSFVQQNGGVDFVRQLLQRELEKKVAQRLELQRALGEAPEGMA